MVRIVRRGAPGTLLDHKSGGKFSMRYVVTRLLVRHASISASSLLLGALDGLVFAITSTLAYDVYLKGT